ncbi:MAG: cupin domain-containing protein [Candidatus Wallbacteria bacterium]|nr:cupin domain-containing protein [Candidatus Wallbacteria bacterium]
MFYAKHYTEVSAQEVEVEGASNVKIRWLVDQKKGAPNFAMRLFEIGAKGHTPFHAHPWEHEIYVLEGSGVMRIEDAEYPLSKGSVALVPEDKKHQFASAGKAMKMICVIPNKGK